MVAGCGGAKGGNQAPESPPPPPAQQYGQPGYGQPGAYPQPSPQPGMVPGPPPPPSLGLDKTRDYSSLEGALSAFEEDEIELNAFFTDDSMEMSTGGCLRICKALDSMRRSADAICQLAGDEDQRCSGARGRLEKNEQRVSEAGCACAP